MKKLHHLLFSLLLLAFFASCEQPLVIPTPDDDPQEEALYLKASIKNVTLTSFDVVVDVPEATPFYIVRYTAEEFDRYKINAEETAATLAQRVEYGATWSTILKVGPQVITFPHLITDTDYKVLAFGLNGAGEITTAPVVLSARTESVSFNLEIASNSPFGYDMQVAPSRDDIGWYGFSFMGKKSVLENLTDEVIKTYMGYYMSNDLSYGDTYDEIATEGLGFFHGESYPDLAVMFTVAAVDSDLKIVSAVKRYIFQPSLEDFEMIDEKNTTNLHSAIYAYQHKELGVLLHVTSYDYPDTGVMAMETVINGQPMSSYTYGVDFYNSTDAQIGNAMANLYQQMFNVYRNDEEYKAYFDQCTSAQQMMEMVWMTPANFYDEGRTWDRNDINDIVDLCGGQMPDEFVFALGINKIRSNYKIYNAECCVSRCSFSKMGYEFYPAASIKALGPMDEDSHSVRNVDAASGKPVRSTRLNLGTLIQK